MPLVTMLMFNSFLLCCSTIDLTEDQHSSDDSNGEETALAATGKFVCPVCDLSFDADDIHLHADACGNNTSIMCDREKGLSKCTICKKEFDSVLIGVHMEQCNGSSGDDDDDDDNRDDSLRTTKAPVGTKVTAANFLAEVKKKPTRQQTLTDLIHEESHCKHVPELIQRSDIIVDCDGEVMGLLNRDPRTTTGNTQSEYGESGGKIAMCRLSVSKKGELQPMKSTSVCVMCVSCVCHVCI